MIHSNLSWKSQVRHSAGEIKSNIGILSKLRYYVNSDILVKLYYALIYPFFFTYGLISWSNTSSSTTQPLFVSQKRAIRVLTFSKFREHSSPIFKCLNIVKLPDLVFLNIAVFMYNFHNRRLPCVFDTFFTQVNKRYIYNTRSVWNDLFDQDWVQRIVLTRGWRSKRQLFFTLYGGQFTFSTQLSTLNYLLSTIKIVWMLSLKAILKTFQSRSLDVIRHTCVR